MASSVEGSSRSTASVEDVWAVWTDPPGWLGGPVETAALDGTFEVGDFETVAGRSVDALWAECVSDLGK